jgi:hypothetical protein
MKIVTVMCLVASFALGGVAHAQDSTRSTRDKSSPAIFSSERLSAEVSKLQQQGVSKQREPGFNTEKLMRPPVLAGIGLMALGGILAATAGESATMTTTNPLTGQTISSTVSVEQNGQRWTGISLLGAGGVLTWLGWAD